MAIVMAVTTRKRCQCLLLPDIPRTLSHCRDFPRLHIIPDLDLPAEKEDLTEDLPVEKEDPQEDLQVEKEDLQEEEEDLPVKKNLPIQPLCQEGTTWPL